MERSSSPIRSKNIKTSNDSGYDIFVHNLQCKPKSFKVRGIIKPLNDIINGHLVPLSQKYKPQQLEKVIILPSDHERNVLILMQKYNEEIMNLKETSKVSAFWLLKESLKKLFSKKKAKKVKPINYYGDNSELESISEGLLQVKYIDHTDKSDSEDSANF